MLKALSKWWHCLVEGHHFEFLRNIYGDEIIECGNKRSVWKCSCCPKIQYRPNLHDPFRLNTFVK